MMYTGTEVAKILKNCATTKVVYKTLEKLSEQMKFNNDFSLKEEIALYAELRIDIIEKRLQ